MLKNRGVGGTRRQIYHLVYVQTEKNELQVVLKVFIDSQYIDK